jgi:hypothetical protein
VVNSSYDGEVSGEISSVKRNLNFDFSNNTLLKNFRTDDEEEEEKNR